MSSRLVDTHILGDKHIQLWRTPPTKFSSTTTNRDAYTGRGVCDKTKRDIAPQPQLQTEKNAAFYASTTSGEAYKPHAIQPRPHIVTEQKSVEPKAKFYGSTTAGSAYVKHEIQPASDKVRHAQTESMHREAVRPFYGTTTSSDTYVQHQQTQQATALKATGDQINLGGDNRKFYGTTTSRQSFVPHTAQEPAKLSTTASTGSVHLSSDNKFYDDTTTKSTYVQHEISKQQSAAPNITYKPNRAYFYGSTTSQETYQPWTVDPPKPVHPHDNLTPSGGFSGTTTNSDTFKGWQLPKQRLSLGLETVNNAFHVMIPKQKLLPATHTEVFTTVSENQHTVEIVVLQGESNKASDNAVLGSFELVGIPPAPVGQPQIQVTFIVNQDSVLHVDAIDKITGQKHHIAILR
eukprot:CAMPEP_0203786080 /NCGR_PEP_ID=MMETSP0100_2-20121128/1404_1 /ASSEMBLY_ACC=CAM_ASM_000210 /TAXON_ID=96639 /ORGANISM=" , Strain NY0313808BC1" /LENGTH=404 /DNA_ID=CAMNT_0050688295 /DNA_START=127 /DNA_END=1337 /DNA_ORIENTATION=+